MLWLISDEQAQKAVNKYLATQVPTKEEFSQLSSEIVNLRAEIGLELDEVASLLGGVE